jgi:hypothetical protein
MLFQHFIHNIHDIVICISYYEYSLNMLLMITYR